MKTRLRRLISRRGNAIVELALVMPIITGAVIFIADTGAATYRNMTLKSAVYAGIDYAVRFGDAGGVGAAIAAAARRDLNSLSVTMTPFCGCATTTVTCGGTCPGGTPQQEYMTVAVSEPYSPMFAINPLIQQEQGQITTLRAQATFRTK